MCFKNQGDVGTPPPHTYFLQEGIAQQNEIIKSEFERVIAHVKRKDQI